ncbi:MAG: response regulator [Gemmatimonadales bacterium]|nr:response regulator [Gemmatimonadales bacterium]
MKILVVEDSFISRRLLCRFLEPFGEIDVAMNGKEALKAAAHEVEAGHPYDLICLDIIMPEMDGHVALKEIRKVEKNADLAIGEGSKVIMTTSLEDSQSIREAFHLSADGYVVKPIEKKKLLGVISELGLELEIPL